MGRARAAKAAVVVTERVTEAVAVVAVVVVAVAVVAVVREAVAVVREAAAVVREREAAVVVTVGAWFQHKTEFELCHPACNPLYQNRRRHH